MSPRYKWHVVLMLWWIAFFNYAVPVGQLSFVSRVITWLSPWGANAQVFAGWGYIVTWHNFHGSSGFGQAFTDSINPDLATLPYQDTIAAARWLMDKPYVDKDRIRGYLSTPKDKVLAAEGPSTVQHPN